MQRMHSFKGLVEGTLIKRYKRFLADVRLESRRKVTAFCANSGSMMGLSIPGMPVLLSPAADPGRKTRWTLEAVKAGRTWVAVNTHLTNRLAGIMIERGLAGGPLKGLRVVRPEVSIGNSRLDYLLSGPDGKMTYLEVKSVTLKVGDEARFPDAVTTRGAKHLMELQGIAQKGQERAGMLYMVQRADCSCFRTADDIDPAYGQALREAMAGGVEATVYELCVRRDGVYLKGRMPLCRGNTRRARVRG